MRFTIHETRYSKCIGDDTVVKMLEVWVVSDTLMDCGLFEEMKGHYAFARLVTREVAEEVGLASGLKHPDADGIALIRKSVADMAGDGDLDALIKHEGTHLLLGHEGHDYEREEKEVREIDPENEVANDLFGERVLSMHPEIRWRQR